MPLLLLTNTEQGATSYQTTDIVHMAHLLELLPSSFGPFLFFSTLLLLAGDLNKANPRHTISSISKYFNVNVG